MLYGRTVQDMLDTLPPAEQAELLALVGIAAADDGHDTETEGTP